MYKLGWFSTGRGEGSRGLLEKTVAAMRTGYLPAEVAFVLCNRDPGEHQGSDAFMRLVKDYGFPLICLSSSRFRQGLGQDPEWRVKYDREVMKRLEGRVFDLGVLAGYMLIVGPEMCHRYPLLNLHPAAPAGPMGTWQEVIWQLVERRASLSGVKMHLATEELDQGPAVSFCTFPITGEVFQPHWQSCSSQPVEELKARYGEELPLFKLIRQQGMMRERPLFVETLKYLVEGKIVLRNGKVYDAEGRPAQGYDLTQRIEDVLRHGDV